MAYADFTLERVEKTLGVTTQPVDLFPGLSPLAVPSWLQEMLTKGMELSLLSEKARSEPVARLFGCVTTGETWQFLRLEGAFAGIDRTRYYIDNIGLVLAVWQAVIAQCHAKD